MTDFLYGEIELAANTGIQARVFQRLRLDDLKEGSDWKFTTGQRVAYGKKGLALAVKLATGEDPEKKGGVAGITLDELCRRCLLPIPIEVPPVLASMYCFYPNRQLIGAKLASGQVVHIRVQTAKNFRRGMELQLRWNEADKMYELARKLPRFPGRW